MITLCQYTTNILLDDPIDDSLMELEKILTILYTLSSDRHFYAFISKIFLGGLWKYLSHPPVSFHYQDGYQWRSTETSNNNLAFPTVGQSGQKYVRTCRSKRSQAEALPDPSLIFDEL
ncbi:unnamed protein product [Rotaria magnacalcarata]|uniref:Uncharacterized protein n=1 Tax=Rotaria magnacalcarata TaxID=392030 RepID=A0A816ZXL3_9BILA|nr:unnamed protein product [Rotaria magnacalcarata]CAF4199492.1 unnamed protein product [Rotaria magnacalcarata]